MRKVSDHMRLVKREAGANPARTRHRDSQATAYYHWETGKGVEASERSVGRPAFRSTGMKSYRSPATFAKPASSTLSAASQLIFAYKTVRVTVTMKIHATRNWQYEICKIRNTSGFILLRSEIRSYGSALWS